MALAGNFVSFFIAGFDSDFAAPSGLADLARFVALDPSLLAAFSFAFSLAFSFFAAASSAFYSFFFYFADFLAACLDSFFSSG